MKRIIALITCSLLALACLSSFAEEAPLTCESIAEAALASAEFRELTDMTERYMEKHLSISMDISAADFEDLFAEGTRDELVATFLALLELIRRRMILVRQPALFAPIRVELREGVDGAVGIGSEEEIGASVSED